MGLKEHTALVTGEFDGYCFAFALNQVMIITKLTFVPQGLGVDGQDSSGGNYFLVAQESSSTGPTSLT